jgi:hypothetical protein
MLIKSVIKAVCRRLIIVILHLTVKTLECYMLFMINTLCSSFKNMLK